MFIDDLDDKKILIFGISSVSISIYKYFEEKVDFSIWDFSEKIRNQFKEDYNILSNIDNISFNDFDYFIISKDILLESDEYNIFLERLFSVKDKVFIDIDFLYKIFYDSSKYIGVIGSGYNYMINSILHHVLNSIDENIFNCYSFEERNNFRQKNDDFNDSIFTISLRKSKISYLKDINFDVLAILSDIDLELFQKRAFLNQKSLLILNVDDDKISDVYDDIINNNDNFCKIIPISINKILSTGFSYVNGTIYDYVNGNNRSYDLNTNFYIDFMNINILCSFVILNELGIDFDILRDFLLSFTGIPNYLEVVEQNENIRFINNIEAINNDLMLSPYNYYDNIYSIIIVNSKQSKFQIEKQVLNNSSKIFLVDLHNLIDVSDNRVTKFNDLKSAFESAINEAESEDKENEINILLTPIVGDDINSIYYYSFGNDFKDLIEDYKKKW